MALSRQLTSPRAATSLRLRRELPNVGLWAAVLGFLFLVFFPIVYLVIMSFKSYGEVIDNFWGLPDPWLFGNYAHGWAVISRYLANTVLLVLGSCSLTGVRGSLCVDPLAGARF